MTEDPTSVAPLESIEDRLSRQFYEWEMRGRGWRVWNAPVNLEPPFRPFFGHYDSTPASQVRDDSRKPTIFSSFIEYLSSFGRGSGDGSGSPVGRDETVDLEPEPTEFEDHGPLAEVQIVLPPLTKISKDAALQFLMSLGHVTRPVSFEIIGTTESIIIQIVCGHRDRRQVREQLQAYFPDALLTERAGYLRERWDETGSAASLVVDFGLSKEFMQPLKTFDRFDPDPLSGLIGAMAGLSQNDLGVIQVLFAPTQYPWPESIMRAVTGGDGDSFFDDGAAMLRLAGQKIGCPLFATVLRVGAQSKTSSRAWRIVQGVGRALRQFCDPKSNELIPLTNGST